MWLLKRLKVDGRVKKVLVTGAAGFIGYHSAKRFLEKDIQVVGLDSLNDYYDPALKHERLQDLESNPGFRFIQGDLVDRDFTLKTVGEERWDVVIHLAAQAGVRYSITNPFSYVDNNLVGFANLLEGCRRAETPHLLFASSSSVYGLNARMPFSVRDNVDHPISLYAAIKKSNELMAHAYAHLYRLPATGLRFFTVYGPWGRPDMAYFRFARGIELGEKIQLYAGGVLKRDFTYIDDIVDGVVALAGIIPEPDPHWDPETPDPSSSPAPYRLYNIGAGRPEQTLELLHLLESELGKEAIVEKIGMQPGDVEATWADVKSLQDAIGYQPEMSLAEGVRRFVEWFRSHYSGGRPIPKA
jgi:UDP-glucuronate 4-epimerase